LCLDISHLWACCVLFKRDFFAEIEILIATNQLRCVHIHANRLPREARLSDIRDGHHSLAKPNEMELPKLVRLFYENQIRHWVIETPEADIQDLQLLTEWLE
jgi:sugar phosphate isomerase/epimerase